MPKVSVIIPVYNVENFLEKCLDSVCNQTLSNIEIICINDFSTDNSFEILKKYAQKDSRIKIIDFKDNKGVAIARNTAIEQAQGEFIGFVDSDDWIDLDFYEKLYNKAVETNSELVIGNVKEVNPEFGHYEVAEKSKINKYYFVGYFWLGLYKRELLLSKNIRFLDGIKYGEDRLLPLMATHYAKNFDVVLDTFYYYNQNPNSVTIKTKYTDNVKDFLTNYNKLFDFINNIEISQEDYAVISNKYTSEIVGFLRHLAKENSFVTISDFENLTNKIKNIDTPNKELMKDYRKFLETNNFKLLELAYKKFDNKKMFQFLRKKAVGNA